MSQKRHDSRGEVAEAASPRVACARKRVLLCPLLLSLLLCLPRHDAAAVTYSLVRHWGSYSGQLPSWTAVATDTPGNIYLADRENCRVVKYASGGTFVTQWGSSGSGNGQFNTPSGVAVDTAGGVYVADSGNNRVQKFTSAGAFVTQWYLHNPEGIAVDSPGNVYVTDWNHQTVHEYTGTGTSIREYGAGVLSSPVAVAVDGSGNVYVGDRLNLLVYKFSNSGALLTQWGYQGGEDPFGTIRALAADEAGHLFVLVGDCGTGGLAVQEFTTAGGFIAEWGAHGTGYGQFEDPAGLATDPAGNVLIPDRFTLRLNRFSASGAFLSWWRYLPAPSAFSRPTAITIDSGGYVYVTDGWDRRVQVFTTAGAFVRQWGSEGSADGQFEYPDGVAVGSNGSVYVADASHNHIQKFSNTGAFLAKWGTAGSGDGQFNSPAGVAVDTSNNLYVADTSNNRIQKFTSNGGFLAKWGTLGSGVGQVASPADVAVDLAGFIYVADRDNDRVTKLTSSWGHVTTWGGWGSGYGQFMGPTGLGLDSASDVYVADMGNDYTQVFTTDGGLLGRLGQYSGGLYIDPYDVAVDASGLVYVADDYNSCIQVFAPDTSLPPHAATAVGAGTWLMGVPLTPTDAAASRVFGTAHVIGWDATTQTYRLNEAQPFDVACGSGYWAKYDSARALYLEGAPPSSPVTCAVSTGWNLLGNPYQTTLAWSQVNGNGLLEPYAWRQSADGSSYELVSDLDGLGAAREIPAWRGMWVRATGAGTVSLTATAPAAVRTAARPSPAWAVRLTASAGRLTDASNFVGQMRGDAALQAANPPLIGTDYVDLYVLDAQGQHQAVSLAAAGAATAWDVRVETNQPGAEVMVRFPDLSAVPRDLALTLTDLDAGKTINMRTSTGYRFTAGEGVTTRRFRVTAGPRGEPLLVLTGVAARPVADGVSVTYCLSSPAEVTITVLNIAGRTVAVLPAGQQQSGPHVSLWSGRGLTGTRVPAGRYLLRLTAADASGNLATALVPAVR